MRLQNRPMIDKILDKAVLIVLIAQIAFILYMNLFQADVIIDFDSSSAYLHEMEMGSQGRVFPSEYSYQSTLDLDGAALISAFLYHFIGDIFISRGITNSLVIFLYVYVTGSVLSNAGLSLRWRRFGILLFLIPYSMIQLGYWRMLFAGGGFFAFRALMPLLLISLILDFEKGNGPGRYMFRAVLMLIIAFLGGLSSGAYLLLCAICPLLLWEAVRGFLKGDYSQMLSKRTGIATVAVIVSFAGIAVQKAVGFSSTADSKIILTSEKWIDALFSAFAGLFELFGGLTVHEQVRLFSAEAVGTAVDFVVTCILIAVIIYTVITSIKKKEISDMNGYILSVMFVNLFMFVFLDLKYGDTVYESRYHLVPMLPSFFLLAMIMDDLSKTGNLNRIQLYTVHVFTVGIFAASMLFGDAQWAYARTALGCDKLKELDRIIEDEGISTAFIVGEDSKALGRKLRVYGKDTHYIVLNDGARSAFRTTFGGTTRYLDNSMHSGRTAIIASPEGYSTLPAYLIVDMKYWRDYDGLSIYVSDESRFDCVSGVVDEKDMLVDFPYSPDYTYDSAELCDDGTLVMKEGGGSLVCSYPAAAGMWNYTVYYEMSDVGAASYVEVAVGDQDPVRTYLDPAVGSVELDDIVMTEGETVCFRIVAPEGTKIRKIEIRRKK